MHQAVPGASLRTELPGRALGRNLTGLIDSNWSPFGNHLPILFIPCLDSQKILAKVNDLISDSLNVLIGKWQ